MIFIPRKKRPCMPTRHYYCSYADACLVLGHVTVIVLFMEEVWQASLVIKVGLITTLNIREKVNYVNIIYTIQISVYVFF